MLLPDSSTLLTVLYPPPLSANPSTGLHSVFSTLSANPSTGFPFSVLHPSLPIPPLASQSVSSTPLCQSLHWLPNQCPPPFSANPSTGLHSVSSTPLCQSLHWPPL
ncbi:unnamed protein product, partial [Staurois parvus]